jgi:hypothetical protein
VVCIPIGNSEILLAFFMNLQVLLGVMQTSLSYLAYETNADDLNAKHPFWNGAVSKNSGGKFLDLFE